MLVAGNCPTFRSGDQRVYAFLSWSENEYVRSGVRLGIAVCALACIFVVRVTALPQALPATAGPRLAPPADARVDINSASLDELMKVPGMTRSWASRIIRFRPYRAKNDILDRGVVTSQIYDRIKDYIIAHRPKQ